MELSTGVLEDPKTVVFKSRFNVSDRVYDKIFNRHGTIAKVWGKENVVKYQNKIVITATFEYSIIPDKKSQNRFRCKESELIDLDVSGVPS